MSEHAPAPCRDGWNFHAFTLGSNRCSLCGWTKSCDDPIRCSTCLATKAAKATAKRTAARKSAAKRVRS